MDTRIKEIENFFNRYESRFNRALKGEVPDIDGTASSFADSFIEASPKGVNCAGNDEQFRIAIPQGYAFYKNIGITSMDIISKEINILDNYHTMAKIHWQCNFFKKDNAKGHIEFDVIYFLQTIESECKIFAYITGDEQRALKENGLI